MEYGLNFTQCTRVVIVPSSLFRTHFISGTLLRNKVYISTTSSLLIFSPSVTVCLPSSLRSLAKANPLFCSLLFSCASHSFTRLTSTDEYMRMKYTVTTSAIPCWNMDRAVMRACTMHVCTPRCYCFVICSRLIIPSTFLWHNDFICSLLRL